MGQSTAAAGREASFPSSFLASSSSLPLSDRSTTPELTRTDSTPSTSDAISLQSHVSVPVTGTSPLGSLRVHKIMDEQNDHDDDDHGSMPALEDLEHQEKQSVAKMTRATTNPSTGDVFLLLGLPPNSTVGWDANAIGTGAPPPPGSGGSSFQGIRDIPPGTHFIWVTAPHAMSRCGYWFVTTAAHAPVVRVKQWDPFNEVLVDPPSQFEVRDLRENVASLLPQLVPYDFAGGAAAAAAAAAAGGGAGGGEETKKRQDGEAELWKQLTCCVTEKVLARVTGKKTATGPAREWLIDTADTAAGENGGVVGPTMGVTDAKQRTTNNNTTTTTTHNAVYQTLVGSTGELHFLFPEGDVDLHEHYATTTSTTPPDTSLDILRLVDHPGTGVAAEDLVGELQLAFLAGLHLANLSCVDQWWHLVLKVFLRAHALLARRPSLSLLFLRTLHAQVVYNEEYVGGGGGTTTTIPTTATNQEEEGGAIVDVRHEYGGGDAKSKNNSNTTSILDIVPGNKRKLRAALTLYKRRLNEIPLDFKPGTAQRGRVSPEQTAVGHVFAELEAWFWRLGWDLRTDHVKSKTRPPPPSSRKKTTTTDDDDDDYGNDDDDADEDDDDNDEDDNDDEYKPVIVDLDKNGREVGMVSFH